MHFGIHLLDRGFINADQLVEAMKKQLDEQPPLGQLAIEEGLLNARQVFSVLRCQSDFSQERFGQTAIDLNLLDRRQVAELLLVQGDRRRPLGVILVELGAIDDQTLESQQQAYRQELERAGALKATEITKREIPIAVPFNLLGEEALPAAVED